jgi:hypothetical protein
VTLQETIVACLFVYDEYFFRAGNEGFEILAGNILYLCQSRVPTEARGGVGAGAGHKICTSVIRTKVGVFLV